MYDAIACARASFRTYAREVDAVFDIAVKQEILNFGRRHNRAVVFRFGRGRTEVGNSYRVFHFKRFVVREVRDIARNFAAFEGLRKRFVVDKSASCEVDDSYAVFAFCKRFGVYHFFRLRVERKMKSDIIRFFEYFVFVVNFFCKRHFCHKRFYGHKRVVSDNVHAEVERRFRRLRAYRSETYYAERFALYLGTYELALSFFDEFCDVRFSFKGFCPLYAADDVSGRKEQGSDNKFFYRIGVCAGGVENNDALFRAFVKRNVVRARTRSGNGFEFGVQRVFVHIRAADKYTVGRVDIVCAGEFVRIENIRAYRRYLVEFLYLKHSICSFDVYAFSVSNFFMNSTSASTPSTGIALYMDALIPPTVL